MPPFVKHFLKFLSIVILPITLIDCKNSDDVPKAGPCEHYYLTEEQSTNIPHSKFYYNTDGTLSAVISGLFNGQRIDFFYDNDNNLQAIKHEFNDSVSVQFEPDQNLISFVGYDINTHQKFDSVVVEYDNEERVIKKSIYNGAPFQLAAYITIEYISSSSASVSNYNANSELSSSWIYTTDVKHRPYPITYDYFLLRIGYIVLPNNVLKVGSDPNFNTYKFEYNVAGYPAKYYINPSYLLSTFVYSCTPVTE